MTRRLAAAATILAAALALVLTGCNDDGANVRPEGGSGSGTSSETGGGSGSE